ncbi:hypothetical protein BDP27DRAFT_1439893 [Rhodocollybia butyracea]|uniref:Uncharacterized protein n=1 Tax=Rhodocollybia butyracea TaxID=206335 RepID=A0A9P5P2Q6_9AGAR|nr:hypothetical protein BDP27DRAFT_1439893 [Rhodocollybia butyracea]
MNHYVPMICSLGVAPGFNTEWLEHLHIDFAKLGYQALNKKDYIKQMTLWLDRREKVLWFTRFLGWALDEDDVNWLETSNVTNKDSEAMEGMEDMVQDEIDTWPEVNQYSESKCLVAKRTPVLNVDLETLTTTYGCSSFVYAMEKFLRQHNLLKPDYWDATPAKYDLYKRVRIIIPPTPEISNFPLKDTVCATAAQPAGPKRRKPLPAQFDTVLARKALSTSKLSFQLAGGPNGLHVAQVHAIFNLPEELGTFAHPLAYVEWFTPL